MRPRVNADLSLLQLELNWPPASKNTCTAVPAVFVGCYSKLAPGQGWWTNIKSDNHLYKVEASNDTLACYFQSR